MRHARVLCWEHCYSVVTCAHDLDQLGQKLPKLVSGCCASRPAPRYVRIEDPETGLLRISALCSHRMALPLSRFRVSVGGFTAADKSFVSTTLKHTTLRMSIPPSRALCCRLRFLSRRQSQHPS